MSLHDCNFYFCISIFLNIHFNILNNRPKRSKLHICWYHTKPNLHHADNYIVWMVTDRHEIDMKYLRLHRLWIGTWKEMERDYSQKVYLNKRAGKWKNALKQTFAEFAFLMFWPRDAEIEHLCIELRILREISSLSPAPKV